MKVLWLGQGGLLFVSGKTKIMIDPYLTNSLSLLDYNLDRQMKINKKLFAVKPSALILTNCHPDHADPRTIERFAKKLKKKLVILSCESVFGDIVCEKHMEGCNNILFESGSEWTIDNVTISAVSAKTDDRSAFGVIITDNETEKKYYVAGDTLYNRQVLSELPDDIYAAFIPINGEYGSMNIQDAKRFARAIDPRFVVPIHFGMFDKIDPMELKLLNMIVPKIYRIIDFEKWDSSTPYKKSLDKKFNERPEVVTQAEFEIPSDEPGINPYLAEELITDEAPASTEEAIVEETVTEEVLTEDESVTKEDAYEDLASASIENQDTVTATFEEEAILEDNFEEDIDEALDEDDTPYEDDEADDASDLADDFADEDKSDIIEEPSVDAEDTEIDDGPDDSLEEGDELDDSFEENEEFFEENEDFSEEDDFFEDNEELDNEDELSDDEIEEEASTSYTSRPTAQEDDADKIDAFIRELERYERGEDPEDK